MCSATCLRHACTGRDDWELMMSLCLCSAPQEMHHGSFPKKDPNIIQKSLFLWKEWRLLPTIIREPVEHTCQKLSYMYSCMLIVVNLTEGTYQLTAFLHCWVLCHSDPHVAELAAMKSLNQAKVFEMDKLKQEMDKLKKKLEVSQTSVAKMCPLLNVPFWRYPHSMDKCRWKLLMYYLSYFNEGISFHFWCSNTSQLLISNWRCICLFTCMHTHMHACSVKEWISTFNHHSFEHRWPCILERRLVQLTPKPDPLLHNISLSCPYVSNGKIWCRPNNRRACIHRAWNHRGQAPVHQVAGQWLSAYSSSQSCSWRNHHQLGGESVLGWRLPATGELPAHLSNLLDCCKPALWGGDHFTPTALRCHQIGCSVLPVQIHCRKMQPARISLPVEGEGGRSVHSTLPRGLHLHQAILSIWSRWWRRPIFLLLGTGILSTARGGSILDPGLHHHTQC